MSSPAKVREPFKEIPSVDELILHFQNNLNDAPYPLYLQTIRKVLDAIRESIRTSQSIENIPEYTREKVRAAFTEISKCNLKQVINGTGIILHTGLGRAPLSKKLIEKAMKEIGPYSNLELDISSGKRGERNHHVADLLKSLTNAEAAVVVNNNAAAVLLMLNALAEGKEVLISRGEQVEIGGSFRIPDVIRKSGCIMVEVGTTNKTHLKDYESAITSETGSILVAHTSNYKVMGFTQSVELNDLSALAKRKKIPLILDLGSGAIADFKKLGLPYESVVKSYISAGVDVVSFSGDKLLGGPQAGIICGKTKFIKKIHKNPLYRALRCDKLNFALLEGTLRSYISAEKFTPANLTLELFQRSRTDLMKIGNKLLNKLNAKVRSGYGISLIETEVEAGSGSLPLEKIPSVAFSFKGGLKATELSRRFRNATTPLLGYIKGNNFHIDLKAIPKEQEKILLDSLKEVLQ